MMNSLYGALVGDAAGATLEFYRNGPITEDVVQQAMRMPGGGVHRVGPGQITDDGELTLTLLRSLNETADQEEAAQHAEMIRGYAAWYESIPFDIGRTCSLAFDWLASLEEPSAHSLAKIESEIAACNQGSQANGALMRASAIATWGVCHRIPLDRVLRMAKQDARLSHPNLVCQEVNAVYVFAIVHLLQHRQPSDVLQMVSDYVDRHVTSECVKEWFHRESLTGLESLDVTRQAGHVRWGFVMAFYFLRHPDIHYEDAIATVLLKGGDTDTNAAIVGGMVGAYQPIPVWMLGPVMAFDSTTCTGRNGRIRPRAYCPKYVLSE